jgi:hypothetical protein
MSLNSFLSPFKPDPNDGVWQCGWSYLNDIRSPEAEKKLVKTFLFYFLILSKIGFWGVQIDRSHLEGSLKPKRNVYFLKLRRFFLKTYTKILIFGGNLGSSGLSSNINFIIKPSFLFVFIMFGHELDLSVQVDFQYTFFPNFFHSKGSYSPWFKRKIFSYLAFWYF